MSQTSVKSIGQVGIPVRNLERAIRFYKDKLRLTFLFQSDTFSFFDCDGVRLFLSLPEKAGYSRASSVIYFSVENIRKTYENWQANGVEFIDEPHFIAKVGNQETWMAFFKDTEDNTLAIMSEIDV